MSSKKQSSSKYPWYRRLSTYATSSKQSLIITIEILLGLIWCLASLMFFILITDEMLERDFHTFDVAVSQLIYMIRTPELTNFMKQITDLGSGITFVIMTLVCVIFLLRQHKKEAVVFSLALIMGVILNWTLKFAIQRPRPDLSPLIHETMSSFPSGHAMNSFIFFALISFFSFHFFRSKRVTLLITILSVLAISLIGFSRVYLGVHYPTDVIAGYVAGFWWFVTVLLVDRTLIFYRAFRRSE